MQCVVVCCSMLWFVAVCCSVFVVAVNSYDYGEKFQVLTERILQCVAVCRSVLQCVAVCCNVLQCVTVCDMTLWCV